MQTVIGLTRPVTEIASGAYDLVSVAGVISALGAAVLGLAVAPEATASATAVTPIVVTVLARLPFVFWSLLVTM